MDIQQILATNPRVNGNVVARYIEIGEVLASAPGGREGSEEELKEFTTTQTRRLAQGVGCLPRVVRGGVSTD